MCTTSDFFREKSIASAVNEGVDLLPYHFFYCLRLNITKDCDAVGYCDMSDAAYLFVCCRMLYDIVNNILRHCAYAHLVFASVVVGLKQRSA